ncbi:MAG: hypothetical protein HWE18_05155 [Gammaproteobacteria bacterium]|nr:hypothetical protein [Gammaproteobacteria bacterium]
MKNMKALMTQTTNTTLTCMGNLVGVAVLVKQNVMKVASYWCSAAFYFGYFSQQLGHR